MNKPYHIDIVLMPIVEVHIEELLIIEGLATESAGPEGRSVLHLGRLLRTEDVALCVERTLQRNLHLVLL